MKKEVSKSDLDALRDYLLLQIMSAERLSEQRFSAMEKAVEEAFKSAQMAIDKADTATEKRFEGVNEFRAQLADQAASFVTREVLDSLIDKLNLQIERIHDDYAQLARRITVREGQEQGSRITKGSLITMITAGVAVIGLFVVLANYLTTH